MDLLAGNGVLPLHLAHLNPSVIEGWVTKVNEHHHDLIAQGLGPSDKINLGGMGENRLKTKTGSFKQQSLPLILSEQGRLIGRLLR